MSVINWLTGGVNMLGSHNSQEIANSVYQNNLKSWLFHGLKVFFSSMKKEVTSC